MPGTGPSTIVEAESDHDSSAEAAHRERSHALAALMSRSLHDSTPADFSAEGFDCAVKSQQQFSPQQAGLQHEGLQPAAQQQPRPQQPESAFVVFPFKAAAPPINVVRANAPTKPSIPRRFIFRLHIHELEIGRAHVARSTFPLP
jgi:hypothetical protein